MPLELAEEVLYCSLWDAGRVLDFFIDCEVTRPFIAERNLVRRWDRGPVGGIVLGGGGLGGVLEAILVEILDGTFGGTFSDTDGNVTPTSSLVNLVTSSLKLMPPLPSLSYILAMAAK
jgi:hypothetical protein